MSWGKRGPGSSLLKDNQLFLAYLHLWEGYSLKLFSTLGRNRCPTSVYSQYSVLLSIKTLTSVYWAWKVWVHLLHLLVRDYITSRCLACAGCLLLDESITRSLTLTRLVPCLTILIYQFFHSTNVLEQLLFAKPSARCWDNTGRKKTLLFPCSTHCLVEETKKLTGYCV